MSLDINDQYNKIYKYCYFKVKNSQIAEDLTQETFLKYFSQKSYVSSGKPLAYLYTIAKNLCIDTYKKDHPELLDENVVSKEMFATFEMNFAIRQAVETLPKDLQEIVLLRFANDLSMAQISDITGLSRFAVYRKITSAIKLLKLVLQKEDFS